MSITPFTNRQGAWDLESLVNLDLWQPFQDSFPSPFSSVNTQVTRKETSTAHVFRAVFPGSSRDDEVEALVYIDDDNVLHIGTADGEFAAKFKLPENSRRDQISTAMVNRVLTVTIPKDETGRRNRNVRTIEISGSG